METYIENCLSIYIIATVLLTFVSIPVVGVLSQSCYVWILLCQCYLYIHCYADAEHCAKEALQIITKQDEVEHLQNFVFVLLVKSLSLQIEDEKLKETVTQCVKVRTLTDIVLCY